MKWIPIDKAKVKFGQLYLISIGNLAEPVTGYLSKSETTATGIKHEFVSEAFPGGPLIPTHIAIITDPNKPE